MLCTHTHGRHGLHTEIVFVYLETDILVFFTRFVLVLYNLFSKVYAEGYARLELPHTSWFDSVFTTCLVSGSSSPRHRPLTHAQRSLETDLAPLLHVVYNGRIMRFACHFDVFLDGPYSLLVQTVWA